MQNRKIALYWALIVILLILTSFCSFYFYYFYDLENSHLPFEKITINESSEMNYNVKLLDNQYYIGNQSGSTYVTALLDEINTHFNYSASFNETVKGEYSYSIIGYLNSNIIESQDNILKREVYNSKDKKFEINGNVINISTDFKIDAESINKLYNDFKKDYNLGIDGTVTFDVVINYSVYSERIGKYISDKKVKTLEYPIHEGVTKIKVPEKEEVQRKAFSEFSETESRMFNVICFEFIGSIILFLLLIIMLLKKIMNSKTTFERKLHLLLRKYDSLIVQIQDLPDLADADVLFVNTFKDLVDASYNLSLPINYIEVVPNKEVVFVITNEQQAYVYKFINKDN